MAQQIKDFIVIRKHVLPSGCVILWLTPSDGSAIPTCFPGQFVQVKTDAQGVMLRRPISICDVNDKNELALFVKPVGDGSRWIAAREKEDTMNIIIPLGHGFTGYEDVSGKKILLAGGGVGAAPLVFLSKILVENGASVSVALGGRTKTDIDGVEMLYDKDAFTTVSTNDGSCGETGLITQNSIFNHNFDKIYCCGPTPMMKAVAKIAKERKIWCEVSLENMMACGLGACLCCVQTTSDSGNVCVCTEGPVFNINRLEKWA